MLLLATKPVSKFDFESQGAQATEARNVKEWFCVRWSVAQTFKYEIGSKSRGL